MIKGALMDATLPVVISRMWVWLGLRLREAVNGGFGLGFSLRFVGLIVAPALEEGGLEEEEHVHVGQWWAVVADEASEEGDMVAVCTSGSWWLKTEESSSERSISFLDL